MAKITVKSRAEKFRRAGIDFTREGIELDTSELTAEQAAAIAEEPALIVLGEVPLAGEKKPVEKGGGKKASK